MEPTQASAKLDSVRYEMFYHRMEQALNEARETIRTLSGSVITREAGELAEAVFLPNGDIVHIACGILIQFQSVTHAIRYMIRNNYGDDIGFYDGDQFINNDAHIGGAHKPDMLLISPMYYKGEMVGWVGNVTHIPEIGANEPGGMSPSAQNFYHEGITLPCIKIVERGRIKRDLMNMMCRSVRDPRIIELDTRAKIAGNERAKKKIIEIIEEFGLDFYLAAAEQMVKDAEAYARNKLTSLHPGTYSLRIYNDYPGGGIEKLGVVELALEVKADGNVIFRTPVISPQRDGFNNVAMPGLEGVIFAGLLTQILYGSRWNSGTMKPVSFDVPKGSVLNVDETGAVGYTPIGLGMQIVSCLEGVLSYASFVAGQYEDVMGPGGLINLIFFGGRDQFGRNITGLLTDQHTCGGGGRYPKDGLGSATYFNPWTATPDIEMEEAGAPLIYLSRQFVADSGGFGQYKGADAAAATNMVSDTPFLLLGSIGMGKRVATVPGIFGGYPAAVTSIEIAHDTNAYALIEEGAPIPNYGEDLSTAVEGRFEESRPSMAGRPVKRGDIFRMYFHGGGGLGDPLRRDPQAIVGDIVNGLTSLRAAREIFCVDLDPNTLRVDQAGTEALRKARREERIRRGIPVKQFVKQLVDRRDHRELPAPALELIDELVTCSPAFCEKLEFEKKVAAEA
ncbi:MAG: hydantoinase B/oxoprolinase family protein [Chloroflexi bacterium]|nr:hydantoinase B/oxoprolinase family protein [Chloroflexota bacterium]